MSNTLQIIFSIILLISISCSSASAQTPGIDSLISLLPSQKEDSTKAMLLFQVATMKVGEAKKSGNWDEAIIWSKMFLATSQKVNFRFGIRRSHWLVATCLRHKGNYAEANNYFIKGFQYALKDNNKVGIVAFSRHIGMNFIHLGIYEEALKHFLAGYKVLQELKYNGPITVQQLSLNIAEAYAKLKKYPEALHWSSKALPENKESFYPGQLSLFIASVHMEMNHHDEALKNLRIALEVFPDRFKLGPEISYEGIAGEWHVDYGDAWLKLASLTKNEEQMTAYHEAIKNLKKSIPLLEQGTGEKEVLMNAYNLLRHAYEAVGDYKNGLVYTNLYMAIRDSMYNQQTYMKFADQFVREKAAVEETARLEKLELNNELVQRKTMADLKLQNEQLIAEEKLNYERKLYDKKLEQQAAFAVEKSKHDKILALQKQEQVKQQLEKKRVNNLLLLGSVSISAVSVLLLLLFRQRTMKKMAIERAESLHQMAELELQSLRSQLNPHFMFNSLNSIQELILMDENEKSHSYLARFSKLLRMLLENADHPFVPLQKELDFLHLYLGLENLRVPDLQYAITVAPEIDTGSTLIPNMILQPHIENAIWHGLSHKIENKQLQVRISRENGIIKYEIEDNGVGRKKAAELKSRFQRKHNSKGIELLNKRFKLLNREFSSEINVSIADIITNNEVRGTQVTIEIPENIFEPVKSTS